MLMFLAVLLLHTSPVGVRIKRPLWINECGVNQRYAARVCGCWGCDDAQGQGWMRAEQILSTAAGVHQLLAIGGLVMPQAGGGVRSGAVSHTGFLFFSFLFCKQRLHLASEAVTSHCRSVLRKHSFSTLGFICFSYEKVR